MKFHRFMRYLLGFTVTGMFFWLGFIIYPNPFCALCWFYGYAAYEVAVR